MSLWNCNVPKFTRFPLDFLPWKCLGLVVIVLMCRSVMISNFSGINVKGKEGLVGLEKNSGYGVRRDKFVEVPQIVWGLTNQKIAFARACLTARMLNRTLLMPSFSALFYKEIDQLEPISFDKVFQLEKFNSLCNGFVRVGRYSEVLNRSGVVELRKGNERKWTPERDIEQLRDFRNDPYDEYEVIGIVGKTPFLWHDHRPVKDYAKVFECLVLEDEFAKEADRVISKIRAAGKTALLQHPGVGDTDSFKLQPAPYMAVHTRIENDWMIHCQKREKLLEINELCSSKEEIIQRVGNIKGLNKPLPVYLAVADNLLENKTILSGWREGLDLLTKKKLAVGDIYDKYPYLIKSAIDYEVCLKADVFCREQFFSSLIVLERTQ